MQKKHLSRFFAGAIALGMLLMVGVNALASQTEDNSVGSPKKYRTEGRQVKDGFKRQGKGQLKEDKGFAKNLQELVKDGTITQAESDKITAYIKEKQEARKSEMEKVKSMTSEERKAYMEAKRGERQELLVELVSKGILTQSKADAIKSRMELKHQQLEQERLKEMVDKVNKVAEAGTITKDQAEKVIEAVEKNHEEKKVLGDKLKAMTKEERKAYMEANKGKRLDVLKKLVEDGTVTQEQADAIRGALRPSVKK